MKSLVVGAAVIAAAGGVVAEMRRTRAEIRTLGDRVTKAIGDARWQGFATCLEDIEGGGAEAPRIIKRVVVPFATPIRGDKISDTNRKTNGYEQL